MQNKTSDSIRKPKRQSGSVFTVLLAGIAMAGALSVVLYQNISGPMSSSIRITNKNAAKTQLQSVSSIVIINATNQTDDGDCDADGSVEPPEWRVGAGPTGGGLVPLTIGAPAADPWGTDYGYCVWDVGSLIKTVDACSHDNVAANAYRLSGSPTPAAGNALSQTVLAIISAGPNRQFNTTCRDYANSTIPADANTDVIVAGGDDIIQRYTYTEASSAIDSLWSIKVGTPTTATIGKNLEVGSTIATVPADVIAAFSNGIVNASAVVTEGAIISGGAVRLANDTDVTSCLAGNTGDMRYNATSGIIEVCNGTAWVAASGGSGATKIDELLDAQYDYTVDHNMIIGENPAANETALTAGAQYNVFIGEGAGATAANSSFMTDDNTAVGYQALTALTSGNKNTAMGTMALYSSTNGYNNTAIGERALYSNTTGKYDTAVGMSALYSNTDGDYNTVMGAEAFDNNTIGSHNTAIGTWSLGANTTANYNTAVGSVALLANTTGEYNTALGYQAGNAGTANTTGTYNTYIGYKAQADGADYTNSTALGNQAVITASNMMQFGDVNVTNHSFGGTGGLRLPNGTIAQQPACAAGIAGSIRYKTDAIASIQWCNGTAWADLNDGVGATKLDELLDAQYDYTVDHNMIIGENPAATETALTAGAKYNVFIGEGAGSTAANSTNMTDDNTSVGYQALNALTSGYNNTAVGSLVLKSNITGFFNTAVGSFSLQKNTTGDSNTAVGGWALYSTTTGNKNTAFGYYTGYANTTGTSNTFIGYTAGTDGADYTNSTALGANAIVTASNMMQFGNASVTNHSFGGTGALRLPNGTIAQQPACAAGIAGSIRYKTDATASIQWCNGTVWADLNDGVGATNLDELLDAQYDYTVDHNMIIGENPAGTETALTAGARYNVFIGEGAGATAANSTATTDSNTAVGYKALTLLTSGSRNTAVGMNSLIENTTGWYNTAVGRDALYSNIGGYNNTAMGYAALRFNTTGQYNTAIGNYALSSNTTGDYNTALGYMAGTAGTANTIGTYNTYIGYEAQADGADYTNSTALGNSAIVTASNMMQFGNASVTNHSFGGTGALRLPNGTIAQQPACAAGIAGSIRYKTDATASIQWCNGTAWADLNFGGAIDDLSDAFTDYVTDHNMILGGNPASANTALAVGAQYNVFVGEGAGATAANSTAFTDNNTAVGYQALTSLATFGGDNTAVGGFALYSNAAGSNNTAVGSYALYLNTTGDLNTAVGYSALRSNTSGYDNIAIGYNALYANTIGDYNTAIGYRALYLNTGDYNTAIGPDALLSNTTGTLNTAIGINSLRSNTTGGYNTVLGYNAGYAGTANTTGTYNTYIGNEAQADGADYTNSTALGSLAIVTASNMMQFGDANVTNHSFGGTGALRLPNGTIAQQPACAAGIAGSIRYKTDATASIQWCNGTAWADLGDYGAIDDLSDGFTDYVTEHNMILGGNPASADTALTAGAQYNVFIGEGAGATAANSTATTDNNTAIGYQALTALTTGFSNVAIGYTALGSNTTGFSNTVIGSYALPSNTTGLYNTVMGMGALGSNTTGGSNTALGASALYANTTNLNTAVGYSSLYANTTGTPNVAMGAYALDANTTGTNNVAIGNDALGANTVNSYNTALGINALLKNNDAGTATNASYNTAIGFEALKWNITGTQNTAVGMSALYSNFSGSWNTAVGMKALIENTFGTNNTALGGYALDANTVGDNNVAIGNHALGKNTNADYNTAVGGFALNENTTGNFNTALGYNAGTAGTANTTGTYNTYIGYEAQADGADYTNSTALGNSAIITASNMMQFGNASVTNHSFGGTGALRLPNGTIAQQPACAAGIAGSIRYKTDATASIQWCNGTAWADLNDGVGATKLDELLDVQYDYTVDHNMIIGENPAANETALTAGAQKNVFIGEGAGATAANSTSVTDYNTALGYQTLTSLTGGWSNTAVGAHALYLNTSGNNNTAMGMQALGSNISGSGNTAVGSAALYVNTSGYLNMAMGYNALFYNTSGIENTAMGSYALYFNTTKQESTAVGYQAMMYADDAAGGAITYNTAVGAYALQGSTTAANNTGTANTAVGHSALMVNTTGFQNTAVGEGALKVNAAGIYNTAIGSGALWSNIASDNTAVGAYALFLNATGTPNVAMGYQALDANTIGTNNVAIGNHALGANTINSYNTAIGINALLANNSAVAAEASYNTAIGFEALKANTTGIRNTAMGYQSLVASTTGTRNTAIGYQALAANTTGIENTAVGEQSLYSNTTASSNTAVGQDALFTNTTGTPNVAVGFYALKANTTGTNNVAIGNSALRVNTINSYNTALGIKALLNNNDAGTATNASYNTAIGFEALTASTTGIYNTAIGANSLRANTTGYSNIAVGGALGNNTTGYSNTAVGDDALWYNTTASNNTAVGRYALLSNTTGTPNVAVGKSALESNTTGTNNVAIGNHALGANTINNYNTALGIDALLNNNDAGTATNASQNTAIGFEALKANTTGYNNTAMGYQTLDANTSGTRNTAIGMSALGSSTTASYNTAIGRTALYDNTTGGYNTALGYNTGRAGTANTTGTYNTYIGYEAQTDGADYTNSTAIGNSAIVTASNMMQFGNASVTNHSFGGTGALRLPNGTIAQQPACAAGIAGSIRYKTDATASIQWCNGTAWADLGDGVGATKLDELLDAQYDYTVDHNMIIGENPAANETALTAGAAYNVFIGEGAGATAANSTATTDWNTALGYQALTSLTSGNRNTAVGFRALDANTTGTNNVAIGNNALGANATTSYNTAVGINALAVNTVSGNTAMGYSALVSNTTGSPNLAIGYYALQSNTTGAYNLAIGYNAMGANTINSRNTAIGYNALASTKDDGSSSNASYNTALGYNAGNAGTANTTGTRNTYIGYEAQANANNYTNSTALGNAAIITASNMMQFGNSNVTNHSFGGTGALRLPNGTIAQQPACAAGIAGSIRYKTDATASIQWCNGTAWADLGGGGATALSAITAATATNNIANENYAQVWNWDTLAGGNALKLASTSTLASTDTQTLLNLSLSGANGTAGQTTYGEYISNTHTGTTSTNVGLYSTASGGTTGNYAAVFDQGKVIIGTTPSNSIFSTYSPGLLIMGQSNDLTLVSASSAGSGVKADIDIMRAGGSPEAFSILAAGDIYGTVRWGGYDGSTWRNAAQVGVRIPDAMSPGVNDMPSEMYFSTRGDGVGAMTEKMVLTSDGMLQLLSSTASSFPKMRFTRTDITLPDYSTSASLGDVSATNTFGQIRNRVNNSGVQTGGMLLQGFTGNGVNDFYPLHLVGTHGGNAPTTAAVTISGQKWNGGDNRTSLTSTTPVLDVDASAGTIGALFRIMGGGNVGIGLDTGIPDTILDISGAFSVQGMAAPALSPAGQGRIYFDSTSNTFKVSQNGSAYGDLVGSGAIDNLSDAFTDYVTEHNMILGGNPVSANAALTAGAQYNVFIGESAGATAANSTSATGANTAVGYQALTSLTSGHNNTAMGYNSLLSGTTASFNTAIGNSALKENITGSRNTSVGSFALEGNTDGTDNTAIGYYTLNDNTTADYNTAVGFFTLKANITGSRNTAMGVYALNANTSGGYNTALGYKAGDAGTANITGTYNTYIGYQAQADGADYTNSAAIGNSAIVTASNMMQFGNAAVTNHSFGGTGALRLPNGTIAQQPACAAGIAGSIRYKTDATASIQWCNGTTWANFGGGAIDDLSDAFTDYVTEHNMILGGNPASANAALTAGARYNVFVGEGAGPVAANSTSAMDQNTAVGYQALTSLTSGGYNTAMGYSTLYDNTTGYQNTAMGYFALSSNTTGYRNAAMGVYALSSNTANYNTAMGYSALYSNTAGACNTAFGYNAGKAGTANTTGTYNTYIGYQAQTNANNYTNSTALGNAAIITSSNSITLGNNAIATIRAQVTTITGISDRRLKKDIVNLDLGLDFIEKLRPVSYRYNNGDETLRYGFIAQEVEKSLGKPAKGIALVVRGTDKKRTYAMGYSELIAPVVNAVQQLSAKFHVLEGKVRGLATEVKDLIVRFNPLEKEVANLKSEVKALKAANLRMQAQIDALVAKQK